MDYDNNNSSVSKKVGDILTTFENDFEGLAAKMAEKDGGKDLLEKFVDDFEAYSTADNTNREQVKKKIRDGIYSLAEQEFIDNNMSFEENDVLGIVNKVMENESRLEKFALNAHKCLGLIQQKEELEKISSPSDFMNFVVEHLDGKDSKDSKDSKDFIDSFIKFRDALITREALIGIKEFVQSDKIASDYIQKEEQLSIEKGTNAKVAVDEKFEKLVESATKNLTYHGFKNMKEIIRCGLVYGTYMEIFAQNLSKKIGYGAEQVGCYDGRGFHVLNTSEAKDVVAKKIKEIGEKLETSKNSTERAVADVIALQEKGEGEYKKIIATFENDFEGLAAKMAEKDGGKDFLERFVDDFEANKTADDINEKLEVDTKIRNDIYSLAVREFKDNNILFGKNDVLGIVNKVMENELRLEKFALNARKCLGLIQQKEEEEKKSKEITDHSSKSTPPTKSIPPTKSTMPTKSAMPPKLIHVLSGSGSPSTKSTMPPEGSTTYVEKELFKKNEQKKIYGAQGGAGAGIGNPGV